jgi:hypothetical protein
MANSNGWGDGAANNAIGWGQGANNAIAWGDSHAKSWAGATDIVGLDSSAAAFISAAGITDATQISAINNLVVGLKSDGIWTKMKAIYPFVGGTASTHKYNLKDPRDLDAAFRLVFNGGWTHSSNGATPNGTNGFADTKLNALSVLTQNSTHIAGYSRTNLYPYSGSGAQIIAGCANSSYSELFDTEYSGGVGNNDTFGVYMNDFTTGFLRFANTDTRGLIVGNRNASNSLNLWRNGSKLTSNTNTTSSNLPNFSMYLSALNWSNAANNFSSSQHSFVSIGNGLTDTEAANLYTRVQAYQTALSRNV